MIAQMEEVQAKHEALELVQEGDGAMRVRGPVGFSIDHDGHKVTDIYQIELHIPDDFPNSPPTVYETDGKVASAFGHFMKAGNFCLGAPVEVRRRFAQHRTLIGFIDDQIIPYLFSYSHKRDHGELPFGDLDHGSTGLLDYYMEFFGTSGTTTLKFLKCLADNFAPPLGPCPCGSRRRLKDCHGPKLNELRPHYRPELFEAELRDMIDAAEAANVVLPEREVLPMRMWRNREKRRRKESRHK
ncbi:MAG: SEC-C domain-containing protein [Phycisphaerales bacterium]